jgi:hypothetical protein
MAGWDGLLLGFQIIGFASVIFWTAVIWAVLRKE